MTARYPIVLITGKLKEIPSGDALPLDAGGTSAVTAGGARSALDVYSTAQVDALIAGLSWKQAVRAATTTAGTLASSFENGDTIDGVTLATGDRILIKDQSTASQNGIYVVAASGAPTRATDADSGAELVNASVYVSEGTANADTQWTCTANAPITPGSTSLPFAQLATGIAYSADGVTLQLVSTTFSVKNLGIATAQLAAAAVTYAKIQDVSATSRVLGRRTAGSGSVEELTLTQLLDFIGSAAQGDILYRSSAGWARLPAGVSGQFLKTLGAGADPAWAAPSTPATWLPAVTGAEPVALVSDGAGQLITVPYTP